MALISWCGPSPAQTIDLHVAQQGGPAGIRNRLFTTWLPPGQAFAGLSGHVTLAGNHPGFSEALVMLGAAPGDRAACAASNGTAVAGMPGLQRFWAGIVKTNGGPAQDIEVGFRLATPVPSPTVAGGTCLATLVSAGYPFLRPDVALYTTTDVHLRVATAPPSGRVVAFGMGGEFKFDTGQPDRRTYVGVRAERRLAVEGIASSISAAPPAGAPAKAGWGAAPAGPWRVDSSFVAVPAASCKAAGLAGHPAGRDISVLRLAVPSVVSPPPGSVPVMRVGLASSGAAPAQSAAFGQALRQGATLVLGRGDCLLVFAGAQGGGGTVDVENQSTVYLVASDGPGR